MIDDETSLTPAEARARFGELLHERTRAHQHFAAPDGGVWRPVFDEKMRLSSYRLYPAPRKAKVRPPYRPKEK